MPERWIYLAARCRCRTCGHVEQALWPILEGGTSIGPKYLECAACGSMEMWPIEPAYRSDALPEAKVATIRDATTRAIRNRQFS